MKIKYGFFSFCFALAGLQGAAQSAPKANSGNPVFPGWYADPEAIVFDNKVWVYPTYSAPYEEQVLMDAFSTTDFTTWTKHARIIDTAAVKWAKKAMWAPSVVKKGAKYFLFFSANDVHEGEVGGIGVAVADKPEGPFKDLLGKPLIGTIHNGAQPIDQYVFQDKGQFYMIYGGWGHCNLVRLNNDFTALLPHPDGSIYKEVTPPGYVEGPIVFTRNNKYYFMWSEGGWTGPNYSVAYATADSLNGQFKKEGTILQQDAAVAKGAGHHSVIQIPGKDEWYIVYHRRPLDRTSAHHRVTCIERMYFDEGGKIKPVKITFEGVPKRNIMQ
jgi:beta-xylosidase